MANDDPAAAAAAVSSDQLGEYETQLNEINNLLSLTPNDESLLSVKADLEELIALTRGACAASTTQPVAAIPPPPVDPIPEVSQETKLPASSTEEPPVAVAAASTEKEVPKKKKKKKVKDFEVPAHLIPLESDSNAERKKKKRAIKMLKNQWRERKKEVESSNKQQSWQSFQKNKSSSSGSTAKKSSIFATRDGSTKVGVISAGSMTEFEERKRHQRT